MFSSNLKRQEMKKLLVGMMVIASIIYGCSNDNDEVSPASPPDNPEQPDVTPESITNLKAIAAESTVTLTWDNPTDNNAKQIEVRCNSQVIVLQKDQTQCVIGKLTNFCDYQFEVVRVGNSGKSSAGVSVAAMPFLPFRVVDAQAVQAGKYKDANGERELIIEADNSFSLTNSTNPQRYKLSGNLRNVTSGEVILDGVFSTYAHSADNNNLNIISFTKDVYSNALTLSVASGNYIGLGWLEKVSGPEDRIEGKYVAYKHSTGELPDYITLEDVTLIVEKNGVWKKSYVKTTTDNDDSSTSTEEQGAFTESNIRSGEGFLLKYDNRYFLNLNIENCKRVDVK
jgi:hypothetical protein